MDQSLLVGAICTALGFAIAENPDHVNQIMKTVDLMGPTIHKYFDIEPDKFKMAVTLSAANHTLE